MDTNPMKILDGGFSTTLENMGCEMGNDPLWGSRQLKDDPNLISQVHSLFIQAGADIITTCSYQASVSGYQEHLNMSHSEAMELIKRSITLARCATSSYPGKHIEVAASIGPYGALLGGGQEYIGDYVDCMPPEQLRDKHFLKVELLADEKPNYLAFETVPAVKEALIFIDILKEIPCQKAWISFTCKDGSREDGEDFSEAVKLCCQRDASHQLVAIGINCTQPEFVKPLLKSVSHSERPFIVYPNLAKWDGKGWVGCGNKLTNFVREWTDLGVSIVGGCCSVLPQDIEELRHLLRP